MSLITGNTPTALYHTPRSCGCQESSYIQLEAAAEMVAFLMEHHLYVPYRQAWILTGCSWEAVKWDCHCKEINSQYLQSMIKIRNFKWKRELGKYIPITVKSASPNIYKPPWCQHLEHLYNLRNSFIFPKWPMHIATKSYPRRKFIQKSNEMHCDSKPKSW